MNPALMTALLAAGLMLATLAPLILSLRRARPGAEEGSRRTAHVLMMGLPVVVAGLSWGLLPTPRGEVPDRDATPVATEAPLDIVGMVERLSQRLAEQPDDAAGWAMLARSQAALQRFDAAVDAYERAARLAPPSADQLADHADALAMAQGQRASGAPEALLQAALRLAPDHPKARTLAGQAAFEQGRWPQAIVHWDAALQHVPPDSPLAQLLTRQIATARAQPLARAAPLPETPR
jgi:cytochrome c-type biogenesis protein CcmH